MSVLEIREQLVESFNEVLQVLDKELINILFEDRDLKGKEDKFLYLQYTDVDEFTLYYDDEFGDGLNVELFKLSFENLYLIINKLAGIFIEDFKSFIDETDTEKKFIRTLQHGDKIMTLIQFTKVYDKKRAVEKRLENQRRVRK